MGGAAAIGLVKSGIAKECEVTVTARHEESLLRFKEFGINATTDNRAAVKGADLVFYVVKPWLMQQVIEQTRDCLDFSTQLIISVAPGVSSRDLLKWLDNGSGLTPALAYVIPNTAIEIGESMTFVAPVTASAEQAALLKGIFDKMGAAVIVEEKMMLAGTSVSSCGIAYAMRYISAAAEGGLELGLSPKEVEKVVCQTVKGAAELIAVRGTHPEEEIDKVTTPGGLTLKGLSAMEKAGFSAAVIEGLKANSGKKRRIVVKVGSNVLTRADGSLDHTHMSSLVDQMVALKKNGCEIILVTSGAVACGRSLIPENRKLDEVQQRQLYSAIGQVRLMDTYYQLFIDQGVNVGQILTMKKNFSSERECANQKSCMEVMLQSGILPIVNENDTVSITELMFTDNDELSGLVASMMGADTLIILSGVDGVLRYGEDGGAEVIPVIRPGESIIGELREETSGSGRGGMISKCRVAQKCAAEGIHVMIANGRREGIISDLVNTPGSTVHTEFTAE